LKCLASAVQAAGSVVTLVSYYCYNKVMIKRVLYRTVCAYMSLTIY